MTLWAHLLFIGDALIAKKLYVVSCYKAEVLEEKAVKLGGAIGDHLDQLWPILVHKPLRLWRAPVNKQCCCHRHRVWDLGSVNPRLFKLS